MSHFYNFVTQISSLIVGISPDFEMGPSARFERVAEGASHQTRIVRVTNDTLGLLQTDIGQPRMMGNEQLGLVCCFLEVVNTDVEMHLLVLSQEQLVVTTVTAWGEINSGFSSEFYLKKKMENKSIIILIKIGKIVEILTYIFFFFYFESDSNPRLRNTISPY